MIIKEFSNYQIISEWVKTVEGYSLFVKKEDGEYVIEMRPLLKKAFEAGRKSMREEIKGARLV